MAPLIQEQRPPGPLRSSKLASYCQPRLAIRCADRPHHVVDEMLDANSPRAVRSIAPSLG